MKTKLYEIVVERTIKRTLLIRTTSAEAAKSSIDSYGIAEAFSDWNEDEVQNSDTYKIIRVVRANS